MDTNFISKTKEVEICGKTITVGEFVPLRGDAKHLQDILKNMQTSGDFLGNVLSLFTSGNGEPVLQLAKNVTGMDLKELKAMTLTQWSVLITAVIEVNSDVFLQALTQTQQKMTNQ